MTSHWFLIHRFKATRDSRAWDRIIKAWRRFIPHLSVQPLVNECEVLTTNLWWTSHFIGSQFGFSHEHATQLMRNDMQQIQDIWNPMTRSFLPWYEVGICYGLLPQDRHCYTNLVDNVPQRWRDILTDPRQIPRHNEYLGLFDSVEAEFPGFIFLSTREYRPSLAPAEHRFTIPASVQFFLPWIIFHDLTIMAASGGR
jgi:hypothetical protein